MSIVLDPFSGSGVTFRVARRLNRDAIAIDCNPVCAELLGLQPCTDYEHPVNQIFIGDCLEVMTKLYEIHGSFIDLIYADPPFGRNSVDKQFGIDWREFPINQGYLDDYVGKKKQQEMSYTEKAYLSWLYPRVKMMHNLLKPTGSLYLHCDAGGSGK